MTDDPTADNWQPLADQPVVPDDSAPQQPVPPQQPAPSSTPSVPVEQAQPSARPAPPGEPPVWAPPAYGPPPAYGSYAPPPGYAPPASPQVGSWVAPGTPAAGFGADPTTPADYLESPPRRRGIGILITIIVVIAVLIAGGVTLIGTHSTKTKKADAAAVPNPSASASPNDSPDSSASAPPSTSQSPSQAQSEPSTPGASSGPLDSYLLAPSDLGAGTIMAPIQGGRSVTDQATLDFCGYDYTSEKLRVARVQVEYLNGTQDASNEFVQYKPGGTTTAYSQIQKAVSGCPSTYTDSNGTLSQVRPITSTPGFAKEHLAITFALTGTGLDGSPVTQWSAVVYQFDGNYFSGVYVYGSSRAQVQQLAVTLAAKAAQHLAEAVAGKPGTGGGTFTNPGGTQGQGAPA